MALPGHNEWMKWVNKVYPNDILWSLKLLISHWGRVTHICVSKLTIIGSDNCLSPSQHQAIIWTNAGILLIGTLGTNFSEILIEIRPFSFKKMHFKMSSRKWQPFCLSLNVIYRDSQTEYRTEQIQGRALLLCTTWELVYTGLYCTMWGYNNHLQSTVGRHWWEISTLTH